MYGLFSFLILYMYLNENEPTNQSAERAPVSILFKEKQTRTDILEQYPVPIRLNAGLS